MNAEISISLSDSDIERIARAVADRLNPTTNTASVSTGQQSLLITEADAARQLGISPHTLKKWRQQGRVKPATTVRPILYRPADVEAVAVWLQSRSQ